MSRIFSRWIQCADSMLVEAYNLALSRALEACKTVVFYATLRFASLHHAMPRHSTLLYASLLYLTLHYSTPLHSTPLHPTPPNSSTRFFFLNWTSDRGTACNRGIENTTKNFQLFWVVNTLSWSMPSNFAGVPQDFDLSLAWSFLILRSARSKKPMPKKAS